MIILERDLAWQRVWWFLSLDETNKFFSELWLPVKSQSILITGVRRILEPAMQDQEKYLSDPGPVVGQVAQWFTHTFSVEECSLMNLWKSSIYVSQSTDRLSEWGWSMVAARLRKEKTAVATVPKWIAELLGRIKSEDTALVTKLKQKIEEYSRESLSAWDRKALELQDASREDVYTTIESICGCNSFVASWEKLAGGLDYEQLLELHEIGKHLAATYHQDSQGWSFPGAWRLEAKPFLAAGAISAA